MSRDLDGSITAVNISAASCVRVHASCSDLGRAAVHLVDKVMASSLAKTPVWGLPDLWMFADRETTCAWLRSTLAMQPMRSAILGAPPSALGAVSSTTRRLAATPDVQFYVTTAKLALDPLRDGQLSGFDVGGAVAAINAGTSKSVLGVFEV